MVGTPTMPDLRPENSDTRLLRVLRARLEHDAAFRESLARVFVADKPTYERYVQRKRREGGPVLPREEWEAYVFGDVQTAQPSEPEPAEAPKPRPGARLGRLFSLRETRHLPKWAAQPVGNPEALFEQAKEAYPQMLDWLDRGEGVDKMLGAHVVRRDRNPDAPIDLDRPGPVMVIAPNKDRKEAQRKVEDRYSGDWREGAVDLVRATIAVDRYDQLPDVIRKLKQSGLKLASQPRDRFRRPTQSGYRDVVINARLPNGHVMELQLHLKEILKAKEEAHKEYRRVKGLDDKIAGKGRGPATELSPDQLQLFDEATSNMRRLFESAWQTVSGDIEPTSFLDAPKPRSDAARHVRRMVERKRKKKQQKQLEPARVAQEKALYYRMDDLPVRWLRPKLPMIVGEGEPYPVDSLVVFAERAVPVDKDEFDELVASRRKPGGRKAFVQRVRRLCASNPEFRRALRDALSQD